MAFRGPVGPPNQGEGLWPRWRRETGARIKSLWFWGAELFGLIALNEAGWEVQVSYVLGLLALVCLVMLFATPTWQRDEARGAIAAQVSKTNRQVARHILATTRREAAMLTLADGKDWCLNTENFIREAIGGADADLFVASLMESKGIERGRAFLDRLIEALEGDKEIAPGFSPSGWVVDKRGPQRVGQA